MICNSDKAAQQLREASRIWLFLDYDGTLSEFAATPDTINPDQELVELIRTLVADQNFQLAIVSGRRLAHIRTLLPVQGLWLAGTYGVELQNPVGHLIDRQSYDAVRGKIEEFKPEWESLLSARSDIYLEDKGWALAIHAKDAADQQANEILATARNLALGFVDTNFSFSVLGGHKFLEICPTDANKGQTIKYLLDLDPFDRSLPVYIGDDDKDEDAFSVINAAGGVSIVVAQDSRQTNALCRLKNPGEVRAWLKQLNVRIH